MTAEQLMTNTSTLRRSPLEHLAPGFPDHDVEGGRGVTLREDAFATMVGIRAVPGTGAHDSLAAATGVGLPAGPGEVAGDPDGTAVLWQGPDEFLLVAPDGTEILQELVEALGEEPGSVVDLSANRTILRLEGPSARLALEKGCPADLHPRVFAPGTALSTTLGPVPLFLWKTGEASYLLLPRASFADYVARWLLDAMVEYSAPEVR
ncbi:sarcosine oxidase subunit gamma [Arthrobacter sp. KK5.5]|uniref:sarcosine oxidase subunit gamma n=1 Tax=Arthrobacter sp. KK5.5 TaxID=3373084 RepID=UPI003EE67C38